MRGEAIEHQGMEVNSPSMTEAIAANVQFKAE
jgi:hypothetical protein